MADKKIKWMMGKVRWFDEIKGEGLVRGEKVFLCSLLSD